MKDDVKKSIADLAGRYREKLELVKKLLLNESDKLHYLKSQNLERVYDLIESDNPLIGMIDSVDYDIAKAEAQLSKTLGLLAKDLYSPLSAGAKEMKEVVSLRNEAREVIKILYGQRELLISQMKKESRRLEINIEELSKIGKLKIQ